MKSMRVAKGMSRSFWFVLLLLTCGALSAQDNNEEHLVRNIVLVHGAWADGSGWKGVYDIQGWLQRQHRARARNLL
jgi:hypothetical protein